MFRRSIELAILVLVAIAFAPTGAYAEVDFGPPKTYAVGTNPVAVVVGDFNGDGKGDLAVANAGSGNDHSIFVDLAGNCGKSPGPLTLARPQPIRSGQACCPALGMERFWDSAAANFGPNCVAFTIRK